MSRHLEQNPTLPPLFKTTPLIKQLDQKDPLVILAKAINWLGLEESLSKFYAPKAGRPALPIRLMIGLLLLKYMFDLSDDDVVAQWKQNVYYQAFTGGESFSDKAPCDASQMARFRKRIGEEGCEIIFKESVRVHGKKVLEKNVIIDTTVQEKNVTFPTDNKLMLKAIKIILSIGAFLNIKFRKRFVRETQQIRTSNNFSKSANQIENKVKNTERLRVIGITLLNTLTKHLPEYAFKYYKILSLLFILKKIFTQRKKDSNKVYSPHEPQVNCIAKGKSYKKYEFGSKVSLVISKGSKIIIGALSLNGNPYDGDTVKPAIKQMKKIHNGYKPKQIGGDRGYRGREKVCGVKVITPYDRKKDLPRKVLRSISRLLRCRPAIEPIIGHLKAEHRLSRNLLKGVVGDKMNPLLASAAFNFLKFGKIKYAQLRKPPKPLSARFSGEMKRRKYHGLPLEMTPNPLF